MKLNEIMRRGWYLDIDDRGGGGAAAGAAGGAVAAGGQGEPDAGAGGGAPAGSAGLTAEEIETRAYAASQRAIADAQRQHDEAQQQRALQAQINNRPWDPTQDAMEAIDLRTEMYEQAMDLYPDLPKEGKDEIKEKLRQFKTVESLRGAKNNNLHELIADAAYGKAMRTGKIQPKTVVAPAREPAYSEPEVNISRGFSSELDELESVLGVKFDDAERRALARGVNSYA